MKIRTLMMVSALVAAGTAMAGDHREHRPGLLFRFDGSIGVQPFRSQAGAPVLNTVAGVNPGGTPWGMTRFEAIITTTGDIYAAGKGVLLWGGDGIGTRAGPRQVILSLFCRGPIVAPAVAGPVLQNAFNSPTVPLDVDGDFKVRGTLTDATGATPPLDCGNNQDNRPVLLIRAVTPANPETGAPAIPGAWFSAGVLAEGQR
jgi:hypothetical protein